jgi:hypothetical protein
MKNLMHGIICLSILFCCLNSTAQRRLPVHEPDYDRPALFKELPSRINCHISNLESLLESPIGKKVNIRISDEIQFEGTVSSVSSELDKSVKSVVIRSGNFQGAALTFSKIIKEDGTIHYSGRIISFQHADVYEINYEKGQYAFVKKGFYDMINE